MIKINKDAIRASRETAKPAKKFDNKQNAPKNKYKILAYGIPNFNKKDENILVYVDRHIHEDKMYSEIAKEMSRFTIDEDHVNMVDVNALKEFQFTYAVELENGLLISIPKNDVMVFRIKK